MCTEVWVKLQLPHPINHHPPTSGEDCGGSSKFHVDGVVGQEMGDWSLVHTPNIAFLAHGLEAGKSR